MLSSLRSAVSNPALLDALADIALAAGKITLSYRGRVAAMNKDDGSPVTIADQEAEELILERLHRLLPGVPIVSEEAACAGRADVPGDDFILVDALDGTKEFLAGSDEFTVNIGLIHKGTPVGAALYAPALSRLWLAGNKAEVCDIAPDQPITAARNRHTIHTRPKPEAGLIAVASLRHNSPGTEACLAKFRVAEKRVAGSSLKFCLLAEGKADLYPRFAPTMEWDTAAGHAVLLAAGGFVEAEDGQPLEYNKLDRGFLNPGFIAAGDPEVLAQFRACS